MTTTPTTPADVRVEALTVSGLLDALDVVATMLDDTDLVDLRPDRTARKLLAGLEAEGYVLVRRVDAEPVEVEAADVVDLAEHARADRRRP